MHQAREISGLIKTANGNHVSLSKVSVIIVNWNGKPYISRSLEGLENQAYRNFDTIIVDNGSSDGSAEFIRERFKEVKIIAFSRNRGFSYANNMAIHSAESKLIALLNSDAVPDPNWLLCLVGALEANPEAGFAASKMLYFDRPWMIDRAGDGYTPAGAGLLRGRGQHVSNYCEPEWIFGACAGGAIYRGSMLKDVGLFDEDFFLLYEDVDLSFRAQLRGYKCIYVPEARVYHLSSQSIGYDSPISVYYSHRNLEWIYIQNMPRKLILKSLHRHFFYILMAFLFFAAKGLAKPYLQAKIDALKGLKSSMVKRKKIQDRKRVSDQYLWTMMETEQYANRLNRRFKKSIRSKHNNDQGALK